MSRNIILVTVDSLRADHCGFLGSGPSDLTPTLDGLAEEGIVFENAVAPGPRTPSSIPESFTGEPLLLGSEDGEGDYWQRRRAAIRRHLNRYRTISERLRERGYATVGVTVNPWTQNTAFDIGFDRYIEINGDTLESYGPPAFRRADRLLRGNRVGDRLFWHNKREWFIRWTDFYETIRAELRRVDRPFFLWVFLLDAHQPYIAPNRFRRESSALGMYYASFSELSWDGVIPGHIETRLQMAYRDSVRSADGFVERLRRDCNGADPVFVVHSDHGEAFGEHGTYGHESELYRENLHVPLVVANVDRQKRVRDPVSLRRIPDLITALADHGTVDPDHVTAEFAISMTGGGGKVAVSGRTWKYILSEDSEKLYRLDSDAAERTNVAVRYPDVASCLRTLAMRRWADQHERTAIADTIREADGVKGRLRGSGRQEVVENR